MMVDGRWLMWRLLSGLTWSAPLCRKVVDVSVRNLSLLPCLAWRNAVARHRLVSQNGRQLILGTFEFLLFTQVFVQTRHNLEDSIIHITLVELEQPVVQLLVGLGWGRRGWRLRGSPTSRVPWGWWGWRRHGREWRLVA